MLSTKLSLSLALASSPVVAQDSSLRGASAADESVGVERELSYMVYDYDYYITSTEYCAEIGISEGAQDDGLIIGTAPFCAGECAHCGEHRACEQVQHKMDYTPVHDGRWLSDYGEGCWTGSKVACCKPKSEGAHVVGNNDQDHITVMSFNMYGIGAPSSKPDVAVRAQKIGEWFNSLEREAVPDVLVLQEVLGGDAADTVRALCTPEWNRVADIVLASGTYFADGWLKKCKSDKHFEYATSVSNPTNSWNAQKSGGVVVLVKKGITVTRFVDQAFADADKTTMDTMAQKGYFAVKLVKGTQPYWVLGTHLQAWDFAHEARAVQLTEIKAFVDENTGSSDRVIFAGDFNVEADEVDNMLETLNAETGTLRKRGFWLPLTVDLEHSVNDFFNHYVHCKEPGSGNKMLDFVLASKDGQSPSHMQYQIVPVKDDECFPADDECPGTSDDLSDHYAIFSSLCYKPNGCEDLVEVQNHRGSNWANHGYFPNQWPNCR